jgi:RNA polymerase sigma-70 factor, ECF subfamily
MRGEKHVDTPTSLTLLEKLRDPHNHQAWRRFCDIYRPMVMGFAVRRGLNEQAAEEVGEDTLRAFWESHCQGKFDRSKGRLRGWLFTVAQRRMADRRRRVKELRRADLTDGSEILNNAESPDDAAAAWEREWQRAIYQRCLAEARERFEPRTIRAFELLSDGVPVDEVARLLDMSPEAAYACKHRIMKFIREEAEKIEQGI